MHPEQFYAGKCASGARGCASGAEFTYGDVHPELRCHYVGSSTVEPLTPNGEIELMNQQKHQDDTAFDIESGYLATLRFLSNLATSSI